MLESLFLYYVSSSHSPSTKIFSELPLYLAAACSTSKRWSFACGRFFVRKKSNFKIRKKPNFKFLSRNLIRNSVCHDDGRLFCPHSRALEVQQTNGHFFRVYTCLDLSICKLSCCLDLSHPGIGQAGVWTTWLQRPREKSGQLHFNLMKFCQSEERFLVRRSRNYSYRAIPGVFVLV